MLYAQKTLVARETLKLRYHRVTSVDFRCSIVSSGVCFCVQRKNPSWAQRTFASAAEALAGGESRIAHHQFQDIASMTRPSNLDESLSPVSNGKLFTRIMQSAKNKLT